MQAAVNNKNIDKKTSNCLAESKACSIFGSVYNNILVVDVDCRRILSTSFIRRFFNSTPLRRTDIRRNDNNNLRNEKYSIREKKPSNYLAEPKACSIFGSVYTNIFRVVFICRRILSTSFLRRFFNSTSLLGTESRKNDNNNQRSEKYNLRRAKWYIPIDVWYIPNIMRYVPNIARYVPNIVRYVPNIVRYVPNIKRDIPKAKRNVPILKH